MTKKEREEAVKKANYNAKGRKGKKIKWDKDITGDDTPILGYEYYATSSAMKSESFNNTDATAPWHNLRNNRVNNGIMCDEIPTESYYSINGYHEDTLIDCRYQTSTVINDRAFIGNIYDISNGTSYGDRVIGTPKFKLDTFSTEFFIPVIPGDGDRIVHLENYSDRLLVFKQNSFIVLNISSEDAIIEEEIKGFWD